MYAALDKNGTLTNAQFASKQEKYFCSRCQKPVKLIFTDSRVYFRHVNRIDNDINERTIHRQGKQLLLDNLAQFNLQSLTMEQYLPEIQQRPDILVNQTLAVEYQCAKINVKTLSERVVGYQSIGMKSLWILGGGYLNQRVHKEHLKFLNYRRKFGYYLLMLDSKNQQLSLFHHVKFIGPFSKISFQKEIFRDDLTAIFSFDPKPKLLYPQQMNPYLFNQLRKKNDPKSQRVKMNFYQAHQQTVEDFLTGQVFDPEPPIFKNPAWQRFCGAKTMYLEQPLLKNKLHY